MLMKKIASPTTDMYARDANTIECFAFLLVFIKWKKRRVYK